LQSEDIFKKTLDYFHYYDHMLDLWCSIVSWLLLHLSDVYLAGVIKASINKPVVVKPHYFMCPVHCYSCVERNLRGNRVGSIYFYMVSLKCWTPMSILSNNNFCFGLWLIIKRVQILMYVGFWNQFILRNCGNWFFDCKCIESPFFALGYQMIYL
jgi:hypothetical protein